MPDAGALSLVLLGLTLGLRHGVDWDHIAAIADITGSTAAVGAPGPRSVAARPRVAGWRGWRSSTWWVEGRDGFWLATIYAVGHATAVVCLGLVALWAGAVLPEWLDPLLERVVGVTLIGLGAWIVYALARDRRSFRLRSRWMVAAHLFSRALSRLRVRLGGEPLEPFGGPEQYGPRTSFAVGLIHGIGAETSSQALLLAGLAGATPEGASIVLLAFVAGLVLSNGIVAALSAFGFASSRFWRRTQIALGLMTAVFSLAVGGFFLMGRADQLPDLQELISAALGS